LRDWLAARVLRQCPAHYITVAQHCSTQLLTGCRGVDPNQVHAVWNGVSLAPESDRESIRQEWSCEQGDVVLGCVARLEQQKDPLFALELLRQLPEHVKLVWVGDGRLRVEFEAATRKHGLESRVRLEGWRADARKRLAGFDIFVLPSVYEGFPFAVLEAMAAGLPCVASDVDGTREAVVTGETGFMCKRGDVGNWLDQLSPLIGDAAMRQHMGARGLERMREFFSLDAMARGTARVYAKAIGRAVGIPA
jgi:glycosyltransferase involved in cell wall biosynthesis